MQNTTQTQSPTQALQATVQWLLNRSLGVRIERVLARIDQDLAADRGYKLNGAWLRGQDKLTLVKRQGGNGYLTKNARSEYKCIVTTQPICVYCLERCTEGTKSSQAMQVDHLLPITAAGTPDVCRAYGLEAATQGPRGMTFKDVKLANYGSRQNCVIACKVCNQWIKGKGGVHKMIMLAEDPQALASRLAHLILLGPTAPRKPQQAPNGYWVI